MKKDKIRAVYDEDLMGVLKRIGISDAFEAGRLFCNICGTPVSSDNLQLIVPRKGGIFDIVCNDPECIEAYYAKVES